MHWLLLTLLLATPAEVEPTAFLGIPLGEPLSIAECPMAGSGKYPEYVDAPPAPCWRHRSSYEAGAGTGVLPQDARVELSGLALPSVVSPYGITAILREGIVVEITAKVPVLRDQEPAAALLTERYGKPSDLGFETRANAFGATVESLNGTWQTPDVIITLIGATKLDGDGIVVAQTKVNALRRLEARKPKGSF